MTTATGYWTTYGDVRGASGVKHRSRDAAEAAVARDQRACERQGGYSDRRVVYVDRAGQRHSDMNDAATVAAKADLWKVSFAEAEKILFPE